MANRRRRLGTDGRTEVLKEPTRSGSGSPHTKLVPEEGGKFNLAADAVVAALALLFVRRLPLPWRGALLALFGTLAVVNGLVGHVANIVVGKATPIDYSGILFVAGGAVLLGLGATHLRIRWLMRAARKL